MGSKDIGFVIREFNLLQRRFYSTYTAADSRWIRHIGIVLKLGSTAFYFEFLMNIIQWIPGHQIRIFSLEYPLVPSSTYPSQLTEISRAYDYILSITSSENIILAGDSAGASLQLALLLHIAKPCSDLPYSSSLSVPKGLILLSPWCHIDSKHETRCSTGTADEDYLSIEMLKQYARLYTGAALPRDSPSIWFPIVFWLEAGKRLC